ncbi:MAG: hypothetical protein HRT55_14100 [Colwellia sp.]|uniref:hypothetical protein n=1 Tax=Alteromonadales TaxID=135622 RepID=UPI001D36C220|nr:MULTISPECIES: hypothetical protein [Alteromonadales]NQZ27437.1 hypothetical protein [Colwellia sp.]NRA80334.1 hypothetical protein [Pseudoalteromonas sp.]
MNQYKYLSPELHDLIKIDIDNVLNKHSDDTEAAIEKLKLSEEESIQLIINGVQQMQQHININKEMPVSELIERLQNINCVAKEQESVDLNDLSLAFAAFLLTIDCDFLGYKFHTENILLDCRAMFERAQQSLKLLISVKELQGQAGATGMRERYKGQDELIVTVVVKWLQLGKPNIFKFNQEHFQEFYYLSGPMNAKINNEGHMHSRIELWLGDFNKLIKGEKVHKPRKVIKELAENHPSTAQ